MAYKLYDPQLTGNLIQKERKAIASSREKFCSIALIEWESDISPESLKKWETGNVQEISINNLIKLCNIFDCELDYLLGQQEYKKKAVADICIEIGLSEESVSLLRDAQQVRNIYHRTDDIISLIDFFVKDHINNPGTSLYDNITSYMEAISCGTFLHNKFPDIYPFIIKSIKNVVYAPEFNSEYEQNLKCYMDSMDKTKLIDIMKKYADFDIDTALSAFPSEHMQETAFSDLKNSFIEFVIEQTSTEAGFFRDKKQHEYLSGTKFNEQISAFANYHAQPPKIGIERWTWPKVHLERSN